MSTVGLSLVALVLSAANSLVAEIDARMSHVFPDIRPTHGFVFTRVAGAGATIGQIATHLGVTKQAASQLVDELVAKGYVVKVPNPSDARSRVVTLTPRGESATRAADIAATEVISGWTETLGPDAVRRMRDDLARVVPPGRVRPTW
ncbi:MarR family winged helix-turn-helix transcriptional regulator [Stackebrandtia soli]|uniref:MarR family winged helix-turn-helix transcriptional regulator n=1 Tax=Stackebrandtia soli TaxID=1892856 RepID=UPI0039E7A237